MELPDMIVTKDLEELWVVHEDETGYYVYDNIWVPGDERVVAHKDVLKTIDNVE